MIQTDTLPIEQIPQSPHYTEIASDTIIESVDSADMASSRMGILLTPPPQTEIRIEKREPEYAGSVIMGILFLLFFVIAFRFRGNRKYLSTLWRNIVEVKERHNMFDDTVRETSFTVLLNALWCVCAGVMVYRLICLSIPSDIGDSFLPPTSPPPLLSIGLCTGVAIAYTLFMLCAYWVVGTVFSTREHTAMWLKGYSATQGLLGFFYFPLTLFFFCYPLQSLTFLWVALIMLIIAKILFIWKGMRIFFNRSSSWVLFLYYLCSLEIVPLILAYIAALLLCSAPWQ